MSASLTANSRWRIISEEPKLELSRDSRGVYSLIVKARGRIRIGSLGPINFEDGLYSYCGSALGSGSSSLLGRLQRHLQKKKKAFWHIDYLLNNPSASCLALLYAITDKPAECTVNKKVLEIAGKYIPYFGASDCREGCPSHLGYFGSLTDIKKKVSDAYRNSGFSCYYRAL